MTRNGGSAPEPWERRLQEGLDDLADQAQGEAPPDLGALLMLVQDVRREQRRALYRDLVRFLAAAAVILSGSLYALLEFPLYFLIAQAALAVALLTGAALWRAEGRPVSDE